MSTDLLVNTNALLRRDGIAQSGPILPITAVHQSLAHSYPSTQLTVDRWNVGKQNHNVSCLSFIGKYLASIEGFDFLLTKSLKERYFLPDRTMKQRVLPRRHGCWLRLLHWGGQQVCEPMWHSGLNPAVIMTEARCPPSQGRCVTAAQGVCLSLVQQARVEFSTHRSSTVRAISASGT